MKATQVIFYDLLIAAPKIPFMGIKIANKGVICAECGSFLKMENVEIVKEYPNWVNFTEEIAGDEYNELWQKLTDSIKNEG